MPALFDPKAKRARAPYSPPTAARGMSLSHDEILRRAGAARGLYCERTRQAPARHGRNFFNAKTGGGSSGMVRSAMLSRKHALAAGVLTLCATGCGGLGGQPPERPAVVTAPD